jgi:hypothetical protein
VLLTPPGTLPALINMAAAEHTGPPPTDSILFILVAFSIGIFIKLGLKWTRIPYTAML